MIKIRKMPMDNYDLYEVYIGSKYLGRIKNFPTNIKALDTIKINGTLYIVSLIYSSQHPIDEGCDIVYYDLEEWEYTPNYDVGNMTV